MYTLRNVLYNARCQLFKSLKLNNCKDESLCHVVYGMQYAHFGLQRRGMFKFVTGNVRHDKEQ